MSTKAVINPQNTFKARQEFEKLREQYLSIICQPLTRGSDALFVIDQKNELHKTEKDEAIMVRFGSIAASLVFQYIQKCKSKDGYIDDDALVAHALYYCYLNRCLIINVPPACSIEFFIELIYQSKYTPTLEAEIERFQRTFAVNDLAKLQWKQVEKTLETFESPINPYTDSAFIADAKNAIAEYRNQMGLWGAKSSERLNIQ